MRNDLMLTWYGFKHRWSVTKDMKNFIISIKNNGFLINFYPLYYNIVAQNNKMGAKKNLKCRKWQHLQNTC